MNAFFIPLNRGFNFAKIRGFKVADYKWLVLLLYVGENTSNVPYEVDFGTFKILDKQVMKRIAIQEQVIFPLRAYDYATTVASNKDERTVFVFDKFTIPADKVLVVEMHEKCGGRHQIFTVESEDIVRAKVINEFKVK